MIEMPAHILLVDDEAAIRLTLGTLLRRRGYNVALAADGPQALEYLAGQSVDLVLLDLLMPSMSGLAVARHVRSLQPAAAILLLTGSDLLAEVEGTDYDYMRKTADPQQVLARVADLLAQRSAAPAHVPR